VRVQILHARLKLRKLLSGRLGRGANELPGMGGVDCAFCRWGHGCGGAGGASRGLRRMQSTAPGFARIRRGCRRRRRSARQFAMRCGKKSCAGWLTKDPVGRWTAVAAALLVAGIWRRPEVPTGQPIEVKPRALAATVIEKPAHPPPKAGERDWQPPALQRHLDRSSRRLAVACRPPSAADEPVSQLPSPPALAALPRSAAQSEPLDGAKSPPLAAPLRLPSTGPTGSFVEPSGARFLPAPHRKLPSRSPAPSATSPDPRANPGAVDCIRRNPRDAPPAPPQPCPHRQKAQSTPPIPAAHWLPLPSRPDSSFLSFRRACRIWTRTVASATPVILATSAVVNPSSSRSNERRPFLRGQPL